MPRTVDPALVEQYEEKKKRRQMSSQAVGDAEKSARAEAQQALARARGEALALRPLEADALDALQAEVLAAAGRIQQAAAEKRAEEKHAQCAWTRRRTWRSTRAATACAECSQSLDECPTCRQNIAGRIRLY